MTADRREEVALQVERFIRHRFHVAQDDERFTRHVNLWDGGYIDSLGVVELITYLEDAYQIKIPDTALFSEGFTRISGIAEVIIECQCVSTLGKREAYA
jgi:acyl carrier protein